MDDIEATAIAADAEMASMLQTLDDADAAIVSNSATDEAFSNDSDAYVQAPPSLQRNDCCIICGEANNGTKLTCRFEPFHYKEEVFMHVFCGKTAAILPHVNMPEYEILTSQGIKNKHGKSNEVQMALRRARSAVSSEGGQSSKTYYLVKEVEAELSATKAELLASREEMRLAEQQEQAAKRVMAQVNFENNQQEQESQPLTKKLKSTSPQESPYKATMDRIAAVVEHEVHGVGYIVVRGITACAPTDSENFNVHQCTQDDMDTLRIVIYTNRRQECAENMSRLVKQDSPNVPSAYSVFRQEYKKNVPIAAKFDLALGFLGAIQDVEWNASSLQEQEEMRIMLVGFARTWKNLWYRPNEELQIDGEFTRKGVKALLEDFKDVLEETALKLKFNCF